MWLLMEWWMPTQYPHLYLLFGTLFMVWAVVGFVFGPYEMLQWNGRMLIGMLFWTDIMNMILVAGHYPQVYWAYGWTVSFIPVIGWSRVTIPLWIIVWAVLGPTQIWNPYVMPT